MPRIARVAPGGLIYHVFNRSVGKMHMFKRDADFLAFERVLLEAHRRVPIPILSYCFMSSHWHFVPWPAEDGQLTEFFRWLAHTHAMRWRVSHNTVGYGHLYQGRFKSFPVESDESALIVCRYVERNALSAGLVKRAEDWRWSSLWARLHGSNELRAILAPGPIQFPRNWIERVNQPIRAKEWERLKVSLERGRPFGSDDWTDKIVRRLHLQNTVRPEGRPRLDKPKRPRRKN